MCQKNRHNVGEFANLEFPEMYEARNIIVKVTAAESLLNIGLA